MILIVAVALIALTVPILGGSLARLGRLRFRRIWLIAGSLALQVLIISVIPSNIPPWLGALLHLTSYAMAGAFLWHNRRIPWLWLVTAGGSANLIAISANNGVMPAARHALATAGRSLHPAGFRNSTDLAGAHVRFLGDDLAIPKGWPFSNVFSLGDIVLVLGCALLLHSVCRSRPATWCAVGWLHLRCRLVIALGLGPHTDGRSIHADQDTSSSGVNA